MMFQNFYIPRHVFFTFCLVLVIKNDVLTVPIQSKFKYLAQGVVQLFQ